MEPQSRLIGYARVSTSDQTEERQVQDILAEGVRKTDLYVDHGVSGVREKRPGLDAALAAMEPGDTLVVTTLDRLGRNAHHMIGLANRLKDEEKHLRVLNLGGESVNTSTAMGAMLFQVLAAISEMEHAIKSERIRDSNEKRRAKGGDLGGRREQYGTDAIEGVQRDVERGVPVSEAVSQRGMSRQTYYRRARALGILTVQD